jgi:tRNA pseudouridine38-40 synthase
MLHQIRKMIGLAVAVMRNCAPESIYDVAFRKYDSYQLLWV